MSVEEYFSPEGRLAGSVNGFKQRPQQLEMARAVEEAIDHNGTLVVEAGTGVGKTFAYLIPAILSALKVVVSTGTRHLQDQLFYTDLPALQKALPVPVDAAILKGRANYLCLYRLKQVQQTTEESARDYRDLLEIGEWSKLTQTGDIAEVNKVTERSMLWSQVTSTRDNCLGGDCPDFKQCHVLKARKRAQDANLVVINHHLLCADLVLKDEGFGELLPTADVFVLDEAHQLTDVLPNFFGNGMSSRQVHDLVTDLSKESKALTADNGAVAKTYYALLERMEQFYATVAKFAGEPKVLWSKVLDQSKVADSFQVLQEKSLELEELLMSYAGDSPGLTQCYKRLMAINGNLDEFSQISRKSVQWLEIGRRGFRLGSVPLDVSVPFQRAIQDYDCTWIYTSATLTANKSFQHFTRQLGLEDAECVFCDSPFDYPKQARLFLPQLPMQPNDEGYTDAVIALSRPLLQASEGNAFILFTSHRALNLAASLLKNDTEFDVLVQGTAAKRELLKEFQSRKRSVLLGTQSFWEGVDVKGDGLCLVIIDKLPFMSPSDPLIQARSRALEEAGENPFTSFQIPQAILNLKQGVGRLIRGERDRGVVVLMDPRIKTKGYGKSFVSSLPAMTVCDQPGPVIEFLETIQRERTR